MPELPEVETTRRGQSPHVEGRRVTRVLDRYTIDEAHPAPVTLRPVYRFEDENREFDEDDDSAGEIVGFDVGSY